MFCEPECSGTDGDRRKQDNLSKLNNLRPITLLNTVFKILTKVLAKNLAFIVENLVEEVQICVIQTKAIHENLHLMRYIIEKVGCKHGFGRDLSNLDQSKAFDNVDHRYLGGVATMHNGICSMVKVNGHHSTRNSFRSLDRSVKSALSSPFCMYWLLTLYCYRAFRLNGDSEKMCRLMLMTSQRWCRTPQKSRWSSHHWKNMKNWQEQNLTWKSWWTCSSASGEASPCCWKASLNAGQNGKVARGLVGTRSSSG